MMQLFVIAVAFVAAVSSVCAGPTPSSEKYLLSYSHKLSVNFKPLKENALLTFVLGMPDGKNRKDTIIYNVVGHKNGNLGVVVLVTGELANWYNFDSAKNMTALSESSEESVKDLATMEKGKKDSDSSEEDFLKDTFDDFLEMFKELQNLTSFHLHKDPMQGGAKNIINKYGWTHPFVSTNVVQVAGFLDGGMDSDNMKWDPINREYTFELYSTKRHMHFELVGGNKTQSDLLQIDLEDEDEDEKYAVLVGVRNPEEGTVSVTEPTPV